MPQLKTSVWRLAQPLAQHASPEEQETPLHAHAPFEQVSGAVHALPHMPQLLLSVLTFTHRTALQQVLGVLHWVAPQLQLPVFEQPVPAQHRPLAPHAALPLHLHAPAAQVSPGLQDLPQAPQLNASVMVSMQPVGQQVVVPVHAEPPAQRQVSPAQVSPALHTLPQPPQFFSLVAGRTQALAQHSSLALHACPPQR